MLEYIKHIKAVTTDFRRSMDFYQDVLGMRPVHGPFGAFGYEMAEAFRIADTGTERPTPAEIACFLRWSDDERDVVLDLGWWLSPRSEGLPYAKATNIGHQRVDLAVGDIAFVYQALKNKGVQFESPPTSADLGREVAFCHFTDPDGIRLGLIQVGGRNTGNPGLQRIHSISICVTDLERSLEFYREVLGMELELGPFCLEGDEAGAAFGVAGGVRARAIGAWVRPRTSDLALVELLQWIEPPALGRPYPMVTPEGHSFANHVGIPRVAFWATDVQHAYEELKNRGVRFVSPPVVTDIGPDCSYCCFLDPDGTILQLFRYVRGSERDYRDA
jgi:catechol 2,3-dioxygenase-like lactoylglutathione lyase family enzyme